MTKAMTKTQTMARRHLGAAAATLLVALIVAAALVAPPARPVLAAVDQNLSLTTQYFEVKYALTGPNATTEEFARRVGQLADKAYTTFVVKGGMRPPRDPRPEILIVVDDPATGGTQATTIDTGDVTIRINYKMQSSMDLAGTVAHEVFHAIQFGYMNSDQQPAWAIEGTAPLAAYLANKDVPTAVTEFQTTIEVFLGSSRRQSLTSIEYPAAAFWAYMQQKYGGLAYLKNLLEAAEDLEWEEAATQAAIKGGAPAGTTFEKLYLEFALAVGGNKVDALKFKTADEIAQSVFSDIDLSNAWSGTPFEVTQGTTVQEDNRDGQPVTRRYPLQVTQYGTAGAKIAVMSASPVTIHLGGDTACLEPYLLMKIADGTYAGAPFPSSGDLTLAQPTPGPTGNIYILLPRISDQGTGWYTIGAKPTAAGSVDTALYSVDDLIKAVYDDQALAKATPLKPASSGTSGGTQPPATPPGGTYPPTPPPTTPPGGTYPPTPPPTAPPGSYPGGMPEGFPNMPVQAHPPASIQFSDTGGHWAASTINQLVQLGVTKGFEDGTFRPQATITRAQFITFVVRSFDIPPLPAAAATFTDVPTSHWASGYAETAVYFGALKPSEYAGGSFGPDVPITRLEMATIAVRALGLEGAAISRMSEPLRFADAGDVPANRVGHIATAVDRQIFGGYQEGAGLPTFKPNRTATRAEASAVIIRLLKAAGRL